MAAPAKDRVTTAGGYILLDGEALPIERVEELVRKGVCMETMAKKHFLGCYQCADSIDKELG